MIQQIEEGYDEVESNQPPTHVNSYSFSICELPTYHIWQSFQWGKLSRLERKMVIHGQTFVIVYTYIDKINVK